MYNPEDVQSGADGNDQERQFQRQRQPREPAIGGIVLYRLTEDDAQAINRQRTTGQSIKNRLNEEPPQWPAGAQAHFGNPAQPGDVTPMLVVRTWHVPGSYARGISLLNGQAFLDGNDTFWVLSVDEGPGLGQWSWPDRSASHTLTAQSIPVLPIADREENFAGHIYSRTVEEEIDAKGLTAPRITPAQVDTQIVSEQYFVFFGTTVTVCCLSLRNGFTVVGESACASPENFDEALGRRIAYDNAKQKIWALEGYLLRERLHRESKAASANEA